VGQRGRKRGEEEGLEKEDEQPWRRSASPISLHPSLLFVSCDGAVAPATAGQALPPDPSFLWGKRRVSPLPIQALYISRPRGEVDLPVVNVVLLLLQLLFVCLFSIFISLYAI
jgi:hypothetical protein